MGCGSSAPAASTAPEEPDAKIIKMWWKSIAATPDEEGAAFWKAFLKASLDADQIAEIAELPTATSEHATAVTADGPAHFTIKGMNFCLTKWAESTSDELIAKANGIQCFVSLPAVMASEDEWKAALSAFAQTVASSPRDATIILIVTGTDRVVDRPAWISADGTLAEEALKGLRAAAVGKTIFSHACRMEADQVETVEFIFNSIVSGILEANMGPGISTVTVKLLNLNLS